MPLRWVLVLCVALLVPLRAFAGGVSLQLLEAPQLRLAFLVDAQPAHSAPAGSDPATPPPGSPGDVPSLAAAIALMAGGALLLTAGTYLSIAGLGTMLGTVVCGPECSFSGPFYMSNLFGAAFDLVLGVVIDGLGAPLLAYGNLLRERRARVLMTGEGTTEDDGVGKMTAGWICVGAGAAAFLLAAYLVYGTFLAHPNGNLTGNYPLVGVGGLSLASAIALIGAGGYLAHLGTSIRDASVGLAFAARDRHPVVCFAYRF